MTRRSRCTSRPTDGRWTLTTTSSPVSSVAAWTWAIDAAASGSGSKRSKTASSGRPRSSSTTARTHRERLGRHLVAAALELGHQLLGEDALAGRDDLAELDVGRAEALGGQPQAAGQVGDRRRAALAAGAGGPQPERGADEAARAHDPHARAAPCVGRVSRGRSAAIWRRRPGTARRQGMASGSTSHGGSSLKLPRLRSVGGFDGRAHVRPSLASERPGTVPRMATGPLDGVRVVELGVWVAGPGAGGLLAEWGADVIKVEPPAGDPMRQLFQLTAGHGQPEVPPFDLDNRGKRSVVLDLRRPTAARPMRRLVATADVFVTNLRPDAVERARARARGAPRR